MKKYIAILIFLASIISVACNKLKITVFSEIDVAGKGNYNIFDIAAVSSNRGPISIEGKNSSGHQYIYVTGSYRGADGVTRCLTAKYDENGRPLWYKLYPESDAQGTRSKVSYGISLLVNTGGGLKEECVYVLAEEGAGNEQKQLMLLKYDSLGGKLLEKTLAQSKYEIVGSFYTDNTMNLYCAGYMMNKDIVSEIFSYKFSPSGDPLWSSTYQNPGLNCHYVLFQMRYPGQLVCAGLSGEQNDLFYIPFDSLGKALDMVVCQSTEQENALADIITDEGGSIYLVASDRWGFSTTAYDGMNTMRWRAAFKDTNGGHNTAHAIAIDDSGCVYVAGSRKDQMDRLVLVKYDAAGAEAWRKTDILIPGKPWGLWFINPDFIHNRLEYGPAFDIDIIGGTKNGMFIARYNTAGSNKAFAQYCVKDQSHFIGAADGKWIAVNNVGKDLTGIRKAHLLKYEEFQIFGINRWD
ncbi:MAG TPA: hypothetical protein VF399_06235 [bacterium]